MIKISGYSFDLKIDSYSLPYGSLSELVIIEEIGGTIPMFEMTISVTNPIELFKVIEKTNTKIKIGYGSDETNILYQNFVLSDFTVDRSGDQYSFTLFGISDVKDFTNTPRIQSFSNMTSNEVLSKMTSLKPVILYAGNDKQTWIQHNTPDRELLRQLMHYSYINDNTYVTYAITSGGEIVVKDGKSIFKETPKLKFSNASDSPDEISYNSYTFQTNSSLLQFLFSEGAKLPILNIDGTKTLLKSVDESSPINGEIYNTVTVNKNFPTVINCLNTHENFHVSKLINAKRNSAQVSKTVAIRLSDRITSDKEVRLLDAVRLIEKSGDINTMVTGMYVLVRKAIHITGENVSTELILGRDFFSK